MATGIVLCLFVVFISTAETQTPKGMYEVEAYDCKALYKFETNVSGAVFRNYTYNIFKTYSAEQFPAVITIPKNSTVLLSIEIIKSPYKVQETAVQKSPETCCSDNVITEKNCRTLNLTCPEKCGVAKWPELPDLYKGTGCSGCTCQYCYIGENRRRQQFVVRMDSHSHLFDVTFLPVNKKSTKIIEPRKKFLKQFQLPSIKNAALLPLPHDSLLLRYFTVVSKKGGFFLLPKPNETLPENGQMYCYLETINRNTTVISMQEYNIKWYSRLNCSVERLQVVYLNDPILLMNCINTIPKSIIYDVDNSNFQMWKNTLYLKELTTQGDYNITISAMYGAEEESRFTAKLQIQMSATPPLLTLNGCQADINFEVLNYTVVQFWSLGYRSLVVFNDRPSSYLIDLYANKTNVLPINLEMVIPHLGPRFLNFTITATAPETCCNGTVNMPRTPLCFDLNLTCSQSCEVIEWQEHVDFYQIRSNESCSSQYCYTGFEIGRQQLSVRLKRSTYKFQVEIPKFYSNNRTLIRQRKRFLKPIRFNFNSTEFFYPLLENASSHQYFEIESLNNTHFLQLKDEDNFPLNGRVQLYFYRQKRTRRVYDVIWYSPPKCNASHFQAKFLNDPLLEMKCENLLGLPIVYSPSSGIFEMKNNLLYLKNLTASIPSSFSINAMYLSHTVAYIKFKDFKLTVPANSSLFKVYGCRAVFNFTLLNYTKLSIVNQQLGIKRSLTDNPAVYVINLPPNSTSTFKLSLNDQIQSYSFTATSSEGCCNHTDIISANCHYLKMKCTKLIDCEVSSWPEYTNFYKTLDCGKCSCKYCYLGKISTFYKFELPLYTSSYMLRINVSGVDKTTIEVNRPRKEFLTSFPLPNSIFLNQLPLPQNDLLQRYFRIVKSDSLIRLQPKNEEILPTSGQFQLYFQPISFQVQNGMKITEYKIKWSSPINCNFTSFRVKYRNSPLLQLNCENTKNMSIVYNISDPNFGIKYNYLYLKDFTMNGPFNISITSMYKGLDESATTINVLLKVLIDTKPLLTVRDCKAEFDFQSLNFSRIDLQSDGKILKSVKQIASGERPFSLTLPQNKTITFEFRINQGLQRYILKAVSSEICCQESSTNLIVGLFFQLKLDCQGICRITDWPNFKDFYKASECKGCKCKYVYIGNTSGLKDLSITGNSSTYKWIVKVTGFSKSTELKTIPRDQLSTLKFNTSLIGAVKLPNLWNNITNYPYFNLKDSLVSVDIKSSTMLPRNGRAELYIYGKHMGSGNILKEYQITWFSPLECKIIYHKRKYLNSPLLSIDCENALQRQIVYRYSNPNFEMKSNAVYLKDFTRNGSYILSITAMYKGLNESAAVFMSNVSYFTRPLLTVNDCTAIFNFQSLNYSRLDLYSQQLELNITLTDKQSYNKIFPQNKTITFYFRIDGGPWNTLKAASSDVCCEEETNAYHRSPCFELKFSCGDACGVSTWPNPKNFHKVSECNGCKCVYCYVGDVGITQNLSVIAKSHTYHWNVTLTTSAKEEKNYTLPRESIFPKFEPTPYIRRPVNRTCTNITYNIIELPYHIQEPLLEARCLDIYDIYPLQWGGFLQTNYDFNRSHNIFTVKPEKAKMFPPNGQFKFLTMFWFETDKVMQEYTISWYSPLTCVVSNLTWEQILDPLLYIDCITEMNRAILYRVSHPNFKMKNNLVYLNDLTTRGYYKFSIIAMYEGLEKSSTTLNVSLKVGQIFITELNATKNHKNRYTFTCYTNSTFNDLAYEWYWNQDKVTGSGLSSSMQNNKSVGKFVFDGLGDKESGNLTCTAKRKGFYVMATKMKRISTDKFPLVKWNTTSNVIKTGSPVNVSCDLFPKYKNSKQFLKVNNQLMKKSKVSLTKESNLSCYGVNDFGRGEIATLQISVAIGKKTCSAVTLNGIKWSETIADTTISVPCIGEFSGIISRSCSTDGKWGDPDRSKCVKKSIVDAKSTLNRIAIIGGNFGTAMEGLANATKQNMTAEDISETIDALNIASNITNTSKEVSKKEVQGFVDTVSNLVGKDSKDKWVTLQKKDNLTAASILKSIENFGNIASQKINKTEVIESNNLVLELQKVDMDENVQFPASKLPEWVEKSNTGVLVPSQIIKDKFGTNESVTMSAVLYKNMKDLLPKSRNNNYSINSYVVAISFGKPLVNLTENISLAFSHLPNTGLKDPSCNFWDFEINSDVGGSWSTEGCVVKSSNSTHTICSCDHLTNFAILMKAVPYKDRKILGIISIVGCSISILALIVTVVIYAICWKYVTSQDVTRSQSILLMNLCASLVIGYLIFLTLVKETEDEVACTVIAALIHYLFLVVFFTMLAEGVDMAIALTVVFTSKVNRLPWLIGLSWGGPAIIVIITLSVTKTVGFGNSDFCWLTTENHANLAFIVPVLIIILANIICVILIVKALLSAYCMLRENIKQRLRTGARAIGILTPLLGFTWIFGVFAVNEDLVAFEYIFAIANSLQGLFIFLAYCVFNKQIQKNLFKKDKRLSQTPTKPSANSTSGTKSTEGNLRMTMPFDQSGERSVKENLKELMPVLFGHFWNEKAENFKKSPYFPQKKAGRNKLSNISKRHFSTDDYLRESSDMRGSNVYETLPDQKQALRYSDNGLNGTIIPYYMKSSLNSSWNNG